MNRIRKTSTTGTLAALMFATVATLPVFAQSRSHHHASRHHEGSRMSAQHGHGSPHHTRPAHEENDSRPARGASGHMLDSPHHVHRPGYIERLRKLPPQERERVLQNDQRFQNLSPARQAEIRRTLLHRWDKLPPQRKEQMKEREQVFSRLSPAQRQQARSLSPEWQQLQPAEKQKIMQAFDHMRKLPPDDRARYLSSPDVQHHFSRQEQQVLRGLGQLLPQH